MFILQGHACPEGTYPSVVLPVGEQGDGRTVVLYQGSYNDEEQADEIAQDRFVLHDQLLNELLDCFDPGQHRLFAYSPTHVVFFQKDHEAEFFDNFLCDEKYKKTDPFIRLSLARLTHNERRIVQEALKCAIALKETPEFLESWLEIELKAILDSADRPMAPPDHRRNILLIEDHLATSHSVEAHFDTREYTVSCAYDGAGGLALALTTRPDIIVLDLQLVLQGDYMDGYEVLRCLTKHPQTRQIPVIIWSQYYEQWKDRKDEFPEVKVVMGDVSSLRQTVQRAFLASKEVDQLGELVELMLT